jgi:hypothetical protein
VRRRAFVAGLAALTALGGCGYRTGFTLPEHQTVGVEVFGNVSKERDIEIEVHDNLTDSLERMVHATLVSPERADLVVRGTVLEYVRRGGIRDKNNVRLENGVRISVQARLVRPRASGPEPHEQVLRQVTVADDRGFLMEDTSGEIDARASALRNITDRLVLDLFGDLAYEAPPSNPGHH